jgi:hypothetical protein
MELAAAMTFDEVAMERSKSFVFALQVPYHTIHSDLSNSSYFFTD